MWAYDKLRGSLTVFIDFTLSVKRVKVMYGDQHRKLIKKAFNPAVEFDGTGRGSVLHLRRVRTPDGSSDGH